jgi:SprT protein
MTEQNIRDLVNELFAKLNTIFRTNIEVPEVFFYRRGDKLQFCTSYVNTHKTCGLASTNCKWLAFNLDVAEEFPEQYSNTVIHEVSHIGQFKLFPNAKQAHGPEFRRICRILGGNGETKGQYNVQPAPERNLIEYKCKCRSHFITKIRHGKIVRGNATYSCKYCMSRIVKA